MYKQVRKTNAFIEHSDNFVRLVSYNTLICEVRIDTKQVLLSPWARCSATTRRHLSEFLGMFGILYYAAKDCLEKPSREGVTLANGYTLQVSTDDRFKYNNVCF